MQLNTFDNVVFKIAQTEAEKEAAYKIRHNAYVRAGYIQQNEGERFSDEFDTIDETALFIACADGTVIGTMRLVVDSSGYGLPIDKEGFSSCVTPLRNKGRKLAEPSRLVFMTDMQKNSRELNFTMQKTMFLYAEQNNASDLVIAVVPKHAAYYEHILLFERLSDEMTYNSLNKISAVVMKQNLHTVRDRFKEKYHGKQLDLYDHFFVRKNPNIIL
jgi:hypothetical protein